MIAEREADEVRRWRIKCAREVGLTRYQAEKFADSGQDLGLLRRLRAKGATPQQIRRIVS